MEILKILDEKIPVFAGVLLVMAGMFFYYISEMMASKEIKTFKDIDIRIWWMENQIRFVMVCMVISIIFWLTWRFDNVTAQHCIDLGLIGNFILDKFLKARNVGDLKRNR